MRAALLALMIAGCASPRTGESTAPTTSQGESAAGAAAVATAFDGCTGMFTPVIGWTFECGGTTVLTREGEEPTMLLRGARTSMRGTFAGPVEERFQQVSVGGAPRSGLSLTMRNAKGQVVSVGTAAILESDAQPMRLVACLASPDQAMQARCQRQLDALAASSYEDLPPSGVRLRARPHPTIAGREFEAPPDCHVTANDRIGIVDCGDAVLGWSEPADPHAVTTERDSAVEDMTRHMHEKLPAAPPPSRSSAPCHIEGVVATCVVAKWPDFTMAVGTALVRGHAIVAWCMARDGTDPIICDDAVEWRPRAPATHVPERGP